MSPADRFSSLLTHVLGLTLGLLMPLSLIGHPAQAQDSGPSKQQKAMHYSLYYESFKNDEFQSAKSDLEWMIENAPGFPDGGDRNYRRYFELYEGLAKKASNEESRRAYLDTAATVLATAPKKMEELGLTYSEYSWEIRKGRFLQQHQDALPDLSTDALKDYRVHYKNAFELSPKEVDPYYIQQVLRGYLENNKQQKALDFVETVESKRGDDEEVQKIIASVRNDIFGKNPQAKVKYLEKQMEAYPDSAGVMQSLFDAYVQQGNIERASKLAPKLMETDPPAETVREIAEMRLEDGRPKAALEAYSQAVEQGAELKAEDYFKRGQAYQQMNSFSKARQEYRKALDADPEFARALIGIGDLYARAVNECSGGELSRKDKAVYWAAVDKYEQAIGVDSSIESIANNKIQSYRKVFPTQEDIFYREDWEQGGSFTIDYGCYSWIGETTTVRQAP